MKLKANPSNVFDGQDDPISLHVRRKWMNNNGQTQKIIDERITAITAAVSSDGSWYHSIPNQRHTWSI
jgi:hypothetical protein